MTRRLKPIHPGEILKHDFLDGYEISEYRLAVDIGVPPRRINEIVHGDRAITADTALRLGRYFHMSPQFWMNLQARYDLAVVWARLAGRLEKEIRILPAAALA